MFAITGATGRVGGHAARTLLDAGQPVRVVARDAAKAEALVQRGSALALADMADADALARAFDGCDGAFIVIPPGIDQPDDLGKAKAMIAAVREALRRAPPRKIVALSSVGAQATTLNLLTELTLLEEALADIDLPITFLRPAWYMENAEWDVASARDEGVIHSYLQPVDRKLPMVSVADAGRVAGELLMTEWRGHRIVELHGPEPVSPCDIADAFGKALNRKVDAVAIPRDTWESGFHQQGVKEPGMWIASLDGFNEGWLDFEGGAIKQLYGRVTIDQAMAALVEGAAR